MGGDTILELFYFWERLPVIISAGIMACKITTHLLNHF